MAECAPIQAPNIINKPIIKPSKKFTWPSATKVMSDIKLDTKFIERAKPQLSKRLILYSKLFEAVQNVPAPGPATPSKKPKANPCNHCLTFKAGLFEGSSSPCVVLKLPNKLYHATIIIMIGKSLFKKSILK